MSKDFYKNYNVKTVSLILTNNCNLSCTYCYEQDKSTKTMSLEMAKKILRDEFCKEDGHDFIMVDFFGGEPFLEFEKIKEIVRYLCDSKFGKPYICFATTNGTLIHGEMQEWLKKHTDCFQMGLSLDGVKEAHDKNRDNSFDDIDIDFFVKTYPKQGIKMTISQYSLPTLFECVKFGHESGFGQINCNLAFGIDWSDKSNINTIERELNKLIDYYLANPYIKPCSMLDMGIEACAHENDNRAKRKWCGTGTQMITYDTDGKPYPCQFFTPLSCGKEKSEKAKELMFMKEIPLELLDEKCQDCPIEPACPTCYGSNYVATGNMYHKDDNLCKLTKIIVKARSYFKAKQWEKGLLKLDENEEQMLLKSILKIQDKI